MAQFQDHDGTRRVPESSASRVSAEVEPFVRGELGAKARAAFVAELEVNEALRAKTRECRRGVLEADLAPLSEEILALVSGLTNGIRGGNQIFPGSSFIAGIENRPGMSDSRGQCYRHAIESARELIQRGQFEDLAFETIERAQFNIAAGERAAKAFPVNSSIGGLNGALGSAFGGLNMPSDLPEPFAPVYLEFAPAVHVGVRERLNSGLKDSRAIRELTGELWELHQSYSKESGGRYLWVPDSMLPPAPVETAASLSKLIAKDDRLREELLTFIGKPLEGTNLDQNAAAKITAARLLLEHRGGAAQADTSMRVVSEFTKLLDRSRTEELSEAQCKLATGLGYAVYATADKDDALWQGIRRDLMKRIASGATRISAPKKFEIHPENELLECCEALPSRIANDRKFRAFLAAQAKSNIRQAIENEASKPAPYWKSESGLSHEEHEQRYERYKAIDSKVGGILLGIQGVLHHFPEEDRISVGVQLAAASRDCVDADRALYLLTKIPPETLNEVQVAAIVKDEKLPAQTGLADICESRLRWLRDYERGHKDSPTIKWDAASFALLTHLDRERAFKLVTEIVKVRGYEPDRDSEIWREVAATAPSVAQSQALQIRMLVQDSRWGGDRQERLGELRKAGVSNETIAKGLVALESPWEEGQVYLAVLLGNPAVGKRLVATACDSEHDYRSRVMALRQVGTKGISDQMGSDEISAIVTLLLSKQAGSIGEFERHVVEADEATAAVKKLACNVSFGMVIRALENELEAGTKDRDDSNAMNTAGLGRVAKVLRDLRSPERPAKESSAGDMAVWLMSKGLPPAVLEEFLNYTEKPKNGADGRAWKEYFTAICGGEAAFKEVSHFIKNEILSRDKTQRANLVALCTAQASAYFDPENVSFLVSYFAPLAVGMVGCESVTPGTNAFEILSSEFRKRADAFLNNPKLELEPDDAAMFASCYARLGLVSVAEKILESTEILKGEPRSLVYTLALRGLKEIQDDKVGRELSAFAENLRAAGLGGR